MTFNIGDTVTVEGIRAPKMKIVEQTVKDDETLYRCLWFDFSFCARHIDLPASFLVTATRESVPLGSIPVIGVAR